MKIPVEFLERKLIQSNKTENKHQHQLFSDTQIGLSHLTLKLLSGILINENDGNGISNDFIKKKRKKRKKN